MVRRIVISLAVFFKRLSDKIYFRLNPEHALIRVIERRVKERESMSSEEFWKLCNSCDDEFELEYELESDEVAFEHPRQQYEKALDELQEAVDSGDSAAEDAAWNKVDQLKGWDYV